MEIVSYDTVALSVFACLIQFIQEREPEACLKEKQTLINMIKTFGQLFFPFTGMNIFEYSLLLL